jgi:hypothetical protein
VVGCGASAERVLGDREDFERRGGRRGVGERVKGSRKERETRPVSLQFIRGGNQATVRR